MQKIYEIQERARVKTQRVTQLQVDTKLKVQQILRDLLDAGATDAVVESSSHALALDRVRGVDYDVAVWTNLTGEHLDFHGTMEQYFAAKAALFTPLRSRSAVICTDDEWGRRLAARTAVVAGTASAVSGGWPSCSALST